MLKENNFCINSPCLIFYDMENEWLCPKWEFPNRIFHLGFFFK